MGITFQNPQFILEKKLTSKIGWLSGIWIIVLLFFYPSPIEASSDSVSDSILVRKFAPVFILTHNPERLERKVLNPEPVEIIGANSIANVWIKAQSESGRVMKNAAFGDWVDPSTLRERIGGASLLSQVVSSENEFAFLRNAGYYFTTGPDLLPGHYGAHVYFDYPGDDERSWNRAYSPEPGEDDSRAGWRFANTVYARVFERPESSDDYGSVVIKYWMFFPL